MSSSKQNSKPPRNRKLKDRLHAMKDFIIGSDEASAPPSSGDRVPLVEETATSGEETTPENVDAVAEQTGSQSAPAQSTENSPADAMGEDRGSDDVENPVENLVTPPASDKDQTQAAKPQEVNLEQIVEDLRAAKSASDRISAVRELGRSKNRRATPHLVAAMFDDEPQVRLAAEEAMAQLDQAATSSAPDRAQTTEADSDNIAEEPVAEPMTSSGAELDPAATDARTDAINGMAHLHLEIDAQAAVDAASAPSPVFALDADATEDEQSLIQEHQQAKALVDELSNQVHKLVASRTGQEKQALWRIKREAKLRSEIAERIREEEEARKRLEAEAVQRRLAEMEAIEAEQTARMTAQAEAYRLAEEESGLRREVARHEGIASEILQSHAAIVASRKAAAQAAELQEAERARAEAEQMQQAAIERVREEEARLHAVTEENERRRAEVEAARQRAERDAQQLAEAQERMRTAAEMRAKAEAARVQLESELLERVEKEERLLVEAREHAQEEKERLAQELRLHHESVERELATLHAEADKARAEAEQRNQAEIERLRQEEQSLQAATAEAERLRAEVEAARERADRDAEELLVAQNLMRTAEEAREKAESERKELEADLLERVEREERLLVEAHQRAQEEQKRLEEEAKRFQESEERRLAELEVARVEAETVNQQLAERERQLASELESLQIADADARKRITAAEARKRAAEQAYAVVADKTQRLEAEAHASAAEEQQMVARFETEKRNATTGAQARVEHEKQIRADLEALRRREEEDQNRLKSLAMQRAEAEAALKKQKEAMLAEEEARRKAEDELAALRERQVAARKAAEATAAAAVMGQAQPEGMPGEVAADQSDAAAVAETESPTLDHEPETVEVSDAIGSYLHSVDPYKRAAAVAELARSKAPNAFSDIVACFDDQAPQVRNAAALALRTLNPARVVDSFNRALEEASEDRRLNIGAAIAGSGLATEAVNNLASESREATYNALSILFVMAKAGQIEPLVQAIEEHENDEVRRAVIKLLTLSGHSAAGDAALQRRVLGVAANRQKPQKNLDAAASEVRAELAEVEVKQAANGKRKPSDNIP